MKPSTWVFGYGSLIWGKGRVKPAERREAVLRGWHREWTWISDSRHGAPTCSLQRDGQVKGVFLKLKDQRLAADLKEFRRRERRETEQVLSDVPSRGATTYFWTMGSNLEQHPELRGLRDEQLAAALADRARNVKKPGPDGKTAVDYIGLVHEFDPDDPVTARIVAHL